MDKQKLLLETLAFYGEEQQILKTVEELNELATALLHYHTGRASAKKVAGELADVEIMCAKIRLVVGKKYAKRVKRHKLDNLRRRFEGDKLWAEQEALSKAVEGGGVKCEKLEDEA